MVGITKGGKKLFRAEMASGFIKKTVGLMGRRRLRSNEAMLFSFPFEHQWSFWMFGMKFSLDLLFLDRNRKIVHIERSAKPLSFSPKTWKTIKSPKKFKYAIEINAGEAENKRIKVGYVLTFTSRS
ncbi:MAG: DUF192 domain-containing protein [Candidatus Aenigmarchaeota archaeon]|nr:DUF192 domain-containing protein [Candidatus Aenigmarchaeota archaeon]